MNGNPTKHMTTLIPMMTLLTRKMERPMGKIVSAIRRTERVANLQSKYRALSKAFFSLPESFATALHPIYEGVLLSSSTNYL